MHAMGPKISVGWSSQWVKRGDPAAPAAVVEPAEAVARQALEGRGDDDVVRLGRVDVLDEARGPGIEGRPGRLRGAGVPAELDRRAQPLDERRDVGVPTATALVLLLLLLLLLLRRDDEERAHDPSDVALDVDLPRDAVPAHAHVPPPSGHGPDRGGGGGGGGGHRRRGRTAATVTEPGTPTLAPDAGDDRDRIFRRAQEPPVVVDERAAAAAAALSSPASTGPAEAAAVGELDVDRAEVGRGELGRDGGADGEVLTQPDLLAGRGVRRAVQAERRGLDPAGTHEALRLGGEVVGDAPQVRGRTEERGALEGLRHAVDALRRPEPVADERLAHELVRDDAWVHALAQDLGQRVRPEEGH
jgi:hypothetical protein